MFCLQAAYLQTLPGLASGCLRGGGREGRAELGRLEVVEEEVRLKEQRVVEDWNNKSVTSHLPLTDLE